MSRSNIGQSDISPLAYAGDTYAYSRSEAPSVPMTRLRADQTAECPPHHWQVTTTELDVYERCVKCQRVQSRPRWGHIAQVTGKVYKEALCHLNRMAKAAQ